MYNNNYRIKGVTKLREQRVQEELEGEKDVLIILMFEILKNSEKLTKGELTRKTVIKSLIA